MRAPSHKTARVLGTDAARSRRLFLFINRMNNEEIERARREQSQVATTEIEHARQGREDRDEAP